MELAQAQPQLVEEAGPGQQQVLLALVLWMPLAGLGELQEHFHSFSKTLEAWRHSTECTSDSDVEHLESDGDEINS